MRVSFRTAQQRPSKRRLLLSEPQLELKTVRRRNLAARRRCWYIKEPISAAKMEIPVHKTLVDNSRRWLACQPKSA